jgi:Cu+-exporting ATPase
MLTEPMPVAKGVGDKLIGATLNTSGALVMRSQKDRVVAAPGFTEDEVLRLAASLDQGSEHPLAAAIVAAARDKGLVLDKVEGFDSISGIGVKGTVTGKALALGNTALMDRTQVAVDALKPQAEALRAEGASVMILAVAGHYNALGVPLAAGVLYPFTGWLLSPMIAAAAMSLSSLSVITNALRLRRAPKASAKPQS